MAAFVPELRAGAQKVDEGPLRVDAGKALAKLRDYRLADPSHYVLDLLRAAVACNATQVKVDVDADDISIVFNGEPLPEKLMRNLLDQALTGASGPDGTRARLLALGVAGALALKPRSLVVRSGGVVLSVDGDTVDVKAERATRTTSFVMKERLNWRVFTEALRGPAEKRVILQHCRQYPLKLTLNGEVLEFHQDWDRPDWSSKSATQTGGAARGEYHVAIRDEPLGESLIHLNTFGVSVGSHVHTLPHLQVHAWVRRDDFSRSITGSEVVREDPAFESAMAQVRTLAREQLEARIAQLHEWKSAELRQSIASYLLFFHRTIGMGKLPATLLRAIEDAPLFEGPAGEWYGLDELHKAMKRHKSLNVARERLAPDSYPQPALLLGRFTNPLHTVLGTVPYNDISLLSKLREKAVARRALMQAWPVEKVELPARQSFVDAAPQEEAASVHRFNDASVEGVLALRPGPIRVLVQGRFVAAHRSESGLLLITAVVNVKGELPLEAYAEEPIDYGWGAVEKALLDATEDALVFALGRGVQLRDAIRQFVSCALRSGRGPWSFSEDILQADIYPDVRQGVWRSLASFKQQKSVRWVPEGRWPEPLNPWPTVVLRHVEHEALKNHFPLLDMSEQLDREGALRKRIESQGKKQPKLSGSVKWKVPLSDEGVRGELGLSDDTDLRIGLTVLWKGFPLERTQVTAKWAALTAVVENDAFSTNEGWTAVQRDAAWSHTVNHLRHAERQLVLHVARTMTTDAVALAMLRRFALDELKGEKRKAALDDVAAAVLTCPLYDSNRGRVSLQTIVDSAQKYALVRTTQVSLLNGLDVPKELVVLVAPANDKTGAEAVLGETAKEARAWLWVHQKLTALRALPEQKCELPLGKWFSTPVETADGRGVAGVSEGSDLAQATVEVLLGQRLVHAEHRPALSPFWGVLELAGDVESWLAPAAGTAMTRAVDAFFKDAEAALVMRAVQEVEQPAARRLLCEVLSRRGEEQLGKREMREVLAAPLLPTLDGRRVGVGLFDNLAKVRYVTEALNLKVDGPVVVMLHDEPLRWLLKRWPREQQEDVTERFVERLANRGAPSPVDKVTHGRSDAWATVSVGATGFAGKIGLVPSGGGTLIPFVDRVAYPAQRSERLPPFLVAAIESEHFSLTQSLNGVVPNEAFDKAVGLSVKAALGVLPDVISKLKGSEHVPLLAQLALWSWGHDKRIPKLVAAPLFMKCDGGMPSISELIESARGNGLCYSLEMGELPKEPLVWFPRSGELALAGKLFTLLEVTQQIRQAKVERETRHVPKFDKVAARAPFTVAEEGLQLEGEVVLLHGPPSGELQLWMHSGDQLLDEHASKHPIGAQVMVTGDSAKLASKAIPKPLHRAIELALERCMLAYLLEGKHPADKHAWLETAIRWRAKSTGPLGTGLPAVPLFKDLQGHTLSLGKIWELSQQGPLKVTSRQNAPDDVLCVSAADRKLLKRLKIALNDVTESLEQIEKAAASRKKRTLALLTAEGVVRHAVAEGGFTGELALAADPATPPRIQLTKERVAIDAWFQVPMGVTGVLNHDGLPVNNLWTDSQLTESMQRQIAAEVDALYGLLATKITTFSPKERTWASRHVLNVWRFHGVSTPGHLSALTGHARALADAPLFETARGEWVPLSAIASQYERSGPIAVLSDGAGDKAFDGLLLMRPGKRHGFDVVNGLATLFGRRLFKPYASSGELKRELDEADPPDGTDLKRGLVRLRRLAKLLAGPSLGRLHPETLTEVRVHRGKNGHPVEYQAERGAALLNLNVPSVARALETATAHPERLYMLLLSIYGAVNRALADVTDDDEARLSSALLKHLAANENALKASSE